MMTFFRKSRKPPKKDLDNNTDMKEIAAMSMYMMASLWLFQIFKILWYTVFLSSFIIFIN